MAQYTFSTELSYLVIAAIREYFATHSLTAEWRWSTDTASRKIEIVKQYPDTTHSFPMITVHATYTSEAENYLSFAGETITSGAWGAQYRTGTDSFDVAMMVYDYGKSDVDAIFDTLLFGMKGPIRSYVEEQSLFNVRPQIQLRNSGEGARMDADQRIVYFAGLTQTMKTTWFDEAVLDQQILSYLTTTERQSIDNSTTISGQFKAS